jgi:GH15 family glucan-1,4-alpha-glucosidase
MIGDCHTATLVSKHGSIDWFCLPHFDSPACFAALIGTAENGFWSISPAEPIRAVRRRYRDGSLILETEFETESGSATLIDCMVIREEAPELLRVVQGTKGQIRMKLELVIRFDYGSVVPWVRRTKRGISAIAGPDMIRLRSDAPLRGENMKTGAEFTVDQGQKVRFDLTWYPSNQHEPPVMNVDTAINEDGEMVAKMVGSLFLSGEVAGRGGALADHPKGPDIHANRGDRGSAYHLSS